MNYFDEQSYLEKLLDGNSDVLRLVSPFQALPLETKIWQHSLTSSGIIFGNIAEQIVKEILISYGAIYFDRHQGGKDIDQYFSYLGQSYMIEQKMRDDHDSTKKVGQLANYLDKKELLPDLEKSACWFIDPNFTKNRSYYSIEIKEELYYGKEINNFLVSIFGSQAETFFDTFFFKLMEAKKQYFSTTFFTFTHPVNLNNVSMSKLYDLFLYGDKEEIFKCFFAGKNAYSEILEHCSKQRKTAKVKAFMEMIKNELEQ